jgi:hypothetical protein
MYYYLFCSLLYALLAAPIFPWPRARSITLGVVHRLMHVAALTALAACIVFFFVPEWAPAWLLSPLSPFITATERFGPAGRPGFAWLPIGALVMAISVPVLAIVDFALRLSSFAAMVKRLLGDIRQAARELAEAIASEPRIRDPMTAERIEAIKGAVRSIEGLAVGRDHAPRRRPLIDIIKK